MKNLIFLTLISIFLFNPVFATDIYNTVSEQPSLPIKKLSFNADSVFRCISAKQQNLLFSDDCKSDWTKKWIKDGLRAKVVNSVKGMTVMAGPHYLNDSDHVVLWTKQVFKGNIKIEYDFTRLDTARRNSVNIIYIQAEGSEKGPYKKEIFEWNQLRRVPSMDMYYDHMNTYHISYAVVGAPESRGSEYIRGRRYIPETGKAMQGTAMVPEYFNTGLFKVGVTYHLTFVKEGKRLFFNVKGDGQDQTFYFSASHLPPVESGRIALRQMFTRSSRYANFKVYQLK